MHQTALHDWHRSHGGRLVDFAGWEMPIQYTSIIEEHQAVRQAAGLFDIAHMGRLRLTGPDACACLDRLLTNNVTRLQPGQVRYSLVCNEAGGILDDVLVYCFESSYLLVVNASNREKIVAWIRDHLGTMDVVLTDETLATFMLAIQGPQALSRMLALGAEVAATLGYYTTIETEVAGLPATLSRTGYTGEDGFEIIVPGGSGGQLWDALLPSDEDGPIVACGLGARDTLRLEAAMPLYGHEMDEQIDPLTAGLSFGVKLNAGDFIGKSALLAIQQQPLTKKRVGLRLEGRRIARERSAVIAQGEPVGTVTSGTFSPTLQQSIAMAYVEMPASAVGTRVTVEIRGTQVPAEVVPLPFYTRTAS